MRFLRFSVLFLVAATAGALGCTAPAAPSAPDPSASAPAPELTCERDRERLRGLADFPEACAADADCPSGSRCDGDRCVADCFTDSDCNGGRACACDGTCVEAPAQDLGRLFTGACTRSDTLLDSLRTPAGERRCTFNDECPMGSYCDPARRVCAWDCRPADPAATCAAGTTCDCNGQCVGQAATPVPRKPRLDVRPDLIVLGEHPQEPDHLYASVEVTLSTSDASLTSPNAKKPSVLVRGDGDVVVSCVADPANTWDFGAGCTLSEWTYAPVLGEYRATAVVRVRAPVDTTQARAQVAFSSLDLINGYVTATVDLAEVARRNLPPPPFEGRYRGTATLTTVGAPGAGAGGLVDHTVQVEAVAANGHVTLVDPSFQLSATGQLPYRWNRGVPYDPNAPAWAPRAVPWLVATTGTGQYVARAEQVAEAPALDVGQLAGSLTLRFPGDGAPDLRVTFDVRRTGDLDAPTCAAGCAAGLVCDGHTQRCLPGRELLAAPPGNTLTHASAAAWRNGYLALRMAVLAGLGHAVLPRAYHVWDTQRNLLDLAALRDASFAGNPFADLGTRVCETQFAGIRYKGDLSSHFQGAPQWGGCKASLPASRTTDTKGWTDKQVCDALYDLGTWWRHPYWNTCMRSPRSADEIAALRRTHAPCLYYATEPSQSTVAAYTCQALHRSATRNGWPAGTWDEFLAQCVETDYAGAGSAYGGAKIILCPVVKAVAADTSAWTDVERLMCWDRADQPAERALESRPLNSYYYLGVSGERRCGDERLPYAAELFTRRDRAIVAPGTGVELNAEQLFDECRADLAATPPALGAITWANLPGTLDAFFGAPGAGRPNHECISLGRFLPALEASVKSGHPLFSRLVQMWVGVHAFVADQGLLLYGADVVNGSEGRPLPGEPPPGTLADLEGILVTLETGWALFFDPLVAEHLARLDGSSLRYPDYRGYAPPDPKGTHDQDVGLPVAMLEGARKYLDVVNTWVEQSTWSLCYDPADVVKPETVQARRGAALRLVAAVERVAAAQVERARTEGLCDGWFTMCSYHGGTCDAPGGTCSGVPAATIVPWYDQYQTARGELAAARSRLAAHVIDEGVCENPLAVRDDDLPLIFNDAPGANSRFFASSDYLVGLATPAAQEADAELDMARSAWQQARQSKLQDAQNQKSAAERRDELAARYGTPVLRACGLENVLAEQVFTLFDPDAPGAMTVETCHRPPSCEPGNLTAACFRGDIGQAALAIVAAKADVEIERARLADHLAAYDGQVRYCAGLEQDLAENQKILQDHEIEMQKKRDEKRNWDIASTVFDSAAQCASSAVASFGTSCVAGALGMFTKVNALEVANQMAQSEAWHQMLMASRQNRQLVKACMHEAEQRWIGIRTAELQILRRLHDVELSLVRMADLQRTARQSLLEGRAMLARETGREVPSVAHHYWIDEHIDAFEWKLARARRLTFLALMAVEYEFQESLALREQIVLARHPDQLLAILAELQELKEEHTVNGRFPGKRGLVVSLREDVLHIEDRSTRTTPGERNWSARTRFQERLLSPQYAIYDSQGAYMGQGIPFSLDPSAEVVWRCAERLDGVTAIVSGSSLHPTQVVTPVFLYKRNTFLSQWCDGHEGTTPMQIGTTRTTQELLGTDDGSGGPAAWVSALISAALKGGRAELSQDGYTQGRSEELAGRGLYGDYILLFPTSIVNDIALGNVDDVLIKFEYWSIDNAPQPG
jgi:hypothetical protein